MRTVSFTNRESGIPIIGSLPWGSRFCQFYQTKEDLLEVLVPYFRAGLENNEFCLWETSRTFGVRDAREALQCSIETFEEYEKKGQIEIIPPNQWSGRGEAVGTKIISMLDKATFNGFDGLRFVCNDLSEKKGNSSGYSELDQVAGYNVIGLVTYPRDRFDALGIMDVVKNHRFALVRNAGRWEVIESSEARIMKDALKRSEEKFRSLFSNMSEGFAYHRIVLDSEGRPCDYIFLEVNEAFERFTGLDGKKIIGKRATEAIPGIEGDSVDWIGKFGRVALTGDPVQFESYSSALERWYSVSAFRPHPGYFAVTFSDITQRKRFENELLRAKKEWEKTFDSVPDLIAILDETHKVVRVNRAMAERLKMNPEQCVGAKCYEAVHCLPGPIATCPHAMSIADGREHIEEVHEPRLGGVFLVSTTPMYDDSGKLLGCVHIARDITERKKGEEALKKAHKELQQHAARLETANKELESFSYSVSHDLRSPLRAIAGFAQMILDEKGREFDPETLRKFNIVQENAKKMGRLIDDLLRLSRLGRTELNRVKVDIGILVREVLQEIRVTEPGREFIVDLHDLPATKGDPPMIRQLFINLLSNSVKFTRVKKESQIEVGSFERSGERVYYVKDNGVGFDMKYYGKLFGVFQRLVTEKEFEGTGVGLAIVKRIVQRHGGRVWAEGKLQEGASFYFTLPEQERR
ncbi:MAG: PAS domain S-box protein [Desulfobacteraceae bacterium]|nr:MAG: PAS domain S-box protein [Desulfobacteraceae bacterium]